MENRESSTGGRLSNHPLFRAGAFPFPGATKQGNLENQGFYNPVVDAIILRDPSEEVWEHELTHHLFSRTGHGFTILRQLAGVSSTLLYFLIHIASAAGLHLTGKGLNTLQAVDPSAQEDELNTALTALLNVTLSNLKQIESVYDTYHSRLLPAFEIAAIDFSSMGTGEDLSLTPSRQISEQRKAELVSSIADRYPPDLGEYHAKHGDRSSALLRAWEAYNAIQDDQVRFLFLKEIMNSVVIEDPVNFILEYAPAVQNMSADEFLEQDLLSSKITQDIDYSNEYVNKVFVFLQENLLFPAFTEYFLRSCYFAVSLDKTLTSYLDAYEIDSFSRRVGLHPNLLTFQMRPNGQWTVSVNLVFKDTVCTGERSIWTAAAPPTFAKARILSPIGRTLPFKEHEHSLWQKNLEPDKNLWYYFLLFETIREALKRGEPVICPFVNCGIYCSKRCPIRRVIKWLQKNSELAVENAICSS